MSATTTTESAKDSKAKRPAAKKAPSRKAAAAAPRPTRKPKAAKAPRALKRDQLEAMLRHPQGAKITEICTAFKIQPHSARGMISTLGKRLGTKAELVEGVYRLPPTEA